MRQSSPEESSSPQCTTRHHRSPGLYVQPCYSVTGSPSTSIVRKITGVELKTRHMATSPLLHRTVREYVPPRHCPLPRLVNVCTHIVCPLSAASSINARPGSANHTRGEAGASPASQSALPGSPFRGSRPGVPPQAKVSHTRLPAYCKTPILDPTAARLLLGPQSPCVICLSALKTRHQTGIVPTMVP